MEAIEATVIDPMHLELKKPLALRAGARVSVVVSGDDDEAETATLEETGAPGPVGHRQREQAWRQTHSDILRGYAGQWLILEGEEIIAHGDDPVDLVSQARERGISSPYVFLVEPETPGVIKIGL